MAYKIEDFSMMAPMRYYNNEAASQKRTDMIEDKDDLQCRYSSQLCVLILSPQNYDFLSR